MQDKLSRVCAFFGLGDVRRFERAGGHAGINHFVRTDDGAYLIKIYPSVDAGGPDTENLKSVMAYLRRLSDHRFRNVPYLRVPGGEQIFMDDACMATAQVRLDAAAPERLSRHMIGQIGAELARLHLVPFDGLPKRATWMDDVYLRNATAIIRDRYLDRDGLSDLVVLAESTYVEWDRLPQSILHGDLFPDNTLYHGEDLVTFIDWDDVCLGASVWDFGMTVVGCCFNDDTDQFDHDLYEALYVGYHEVRAFTSRERAAITAAVQRAGASAAIWRFLQWNHYNSDGQPNEEYRAFWAQGIDRWEAP